MKEYKCIIFDCDGVLVDSEVLGNQVFVDMANENGAEIDISYAMQHFKGGFLIIRIPRCSASEVLEESLKTDSFHKMIKLSSVEYLDGSASRIIYWTVSNKWRRSSKNHCPWILKENIAIDPTKYFRRILNR